MEKRKGRSLNAIYSRPLPLTLSVDKFGQLPQITVHNPVSWVYLLYRVASIYFQTPPQKLEPKSNVEVVDVGTDVVFYVNDSQDMERLWRQGFFGKGTLSRSDPTWENRVQRRLNLHGAAGKDLSKEDVTNVRREDRKAFKALRSKSQEFETIARKRGLTSVEQNEWDTVKQEMETMKSSNSFRIQAGQNQEDSMRQEDMDLIDPVTNALRRNLESLQLQKVELFFLHFALDVVSIIRDSQQLSVNDVFGLCMRGSIVPHNKFLLDYAVYHHFRSMGWCVRSGIKFGCDMLLYKRGPPFMHAEYAILVIPNNGEEWTTWEDFMAIARVVSGVKKTLVLAYVDIPETLVFDHVMSISDSTERFRTLFQHYKVTEVIYKRWSPSRTRD
ncbi:hypothetical protein JCM33374_g5971 [Metschnikowia sp. JCM 33374]|nr:hypothetical protein JCM33374_g5971 [Metschnikowia sp. JCM 33374]